MPSYDAGSASVRIRPNADDFVRDLRRQLAGVRDPGFSVTVSADVADAARETGDWRQREEREAVDLDVDADVSAASAQMARWRRTEESNPIGIDVDVDTAGASAHMQTWRATQQTQALQIRVDVDTSALQRLGGAGGSFGGGGGGRGGGLLAGLIPAAGAGALASLPALGSIVANLTQSITQLAGAGLVIPGVIGGIASTAITAKVGFTGMADALEAVNQAADGTPESLQAAEAALAQLAPAAANAVKAVAELQPEWERAVRDTFQQNMFVGLDDNIRDSFASAFPVVEAGLGDISNAWNGTFAELLSVAGSDSTKGILTRIFGNTADSQRIANGAIEPFTSALGTLTATGAEALPRLAGDLDSVATRLDNWVGSAAADGRLDEWIGRGITGFENLGNTVINLGGFIGGVASATDGNLLASLERVTAQWDEWVNSTEGQESLKQFIADGDALLSSLANTAKNLGPELKAAFDLSSTAVGTLLTSIEGITGALKAVETALPGFSESFKNALAGPIGMVNQLKSVLDNNPLASDMAQGKLDAALAAARGNDARTQPVLAPTNPAGGPAIAAPVPQGPGLRPTRAPTGAGSWEQLLVPSREEGGPVSTTGPALLHGTPGQPEFVQRASAVRKYGVPFMAALNAGDIKLGSFEGGGPVFDENGNPVNQSGPAPGPTVGTTGPIAPNPTAGRGGLGDIFAQVVSGAQSAAGNALALGQQLGSLAQSAPGAVDAPAPGMQTQHGVGTLAPPPSIAAQTPSSLFNITGATQAGTPMGNLASRAATIPGFAGLPGALASPDPAGNLMQWGSNSLQYLANWGMDTIGKVGGALWQGGLGFFGLENSILSPSNVYNQALASTGQFALDGSGPLGVLLGAAGGQSQLTPSGGSLDSLTAEQVQQIAAQNGGLPPGMELPKGVGSEKGLQVNTIRAKRAISAAFPGIAKIGGYREDDLKWHPNGLAIDVMVPGFDTPEGKAYGDKIYAFVAQNADALGVDMGATLWQTKDHFDHLHIATTGGGYPDKGTQFTMPGQLPAMDTGGPTPSAPGPVDAKGGHLAVVHPDEFMISARGRASVPDGFLHRLNKGLVDPKDLPGYYPGGPIAAAGVRPLPLPPPVQARTMNPVAPARPAMPAPVAPPVAATAPTPGPTAAPVAPVAPTPAAPTGDPSAPISAPTTTGGAQIAAAPASTNHNLDAVNTLIDSSASNIGQIVSTAMSIASMGGAGIPGMGAVGAAGPFVAGGIQEVGKIVKGAVNVVSSSLVGNVPGSFGGEPGASPYGRTVRPAQDAPITSPVRNTTYNVSGNYELRRAMEQLELRESISAQADLAHHK